MAGKTDSALHETLSRLDANTRTGINNATQIQEAKHHPLSVTALLQQVPDPPVRPALVPPQPLLPAFSYRLPADPCDREANTL